MEFGDFITTQVRQMRKDKFDKSDQLSLGDIIDKMKIIINNHKNDEKDKKVFIQYDFEYLFPLTFSSWRGSYDELALDINMYDYSDKKTINYWAIL